MLIPLVIVAVMMPTPMIMVPPMVIVVVLAIPVSFVPFPAFPIVVIVRMRPVGSFKRGTFPMSSHPFVVVTHGSPISFDPHESGVRRRRGFFINDCWWRGPDVHRNLC